MFERCRLLHSPSQYTITETLAMSEAKCFINDCCIVISLHMPDQNMNVLRLVKSTFDILLLPLHLSSPSFLANINGPPCHKTNDHYRGNNVTF
ncbi:hypothetical protein AVEN_192946-1 [Araneus ventricosus]|uniref:Uncharacterized protein n=1 Tax=Araneus ventricosus TaxID=182803 RepID=A0A4Y2NLN4_ARAVE|nr:hypothetical protein AVEN_192946-1 [Araneus ventricosus]